jgi:hypothetical protein
MESIFLKSEKFSSGPKVFTPSMNPYFKVIKTISENDYILSIQSSRLKIIEEN